MLNADNGTYDSWWYPHPPVYMPEGCNLDDCTAVQQNVKIPVACAGRMENPDLALDAVKTGKVQAICLARQLLADPDYCNKLEKEETDDIRPCIACHAGCLGRIFKGQDLCCALNPAVAREDAYELTEAKVKKHVLIIGGGIGGMEAARVSAIRGHKVDLYETSNQLGGVFIPASNMSFKASDKRLIAWYKLQMEKLGVNIHMNTPVTQELIAEVNPDVIFQATGSTTRTLNLPGKENEYVLTAVDALNNPDKVKGEIVVIGGGLTGIEIAYEYAKSGSKVTVLEAMDKILNVDIAAANKNFLLAAINVHNINIVKNAKVTSFENNNVTYNIDDKEHNVHADTVIVSVGYNSNAPFNIEEKEFYTIGDANKVSNLMGAIWDAYETAMKI